MMTRKNNNKILLLLSQLLILIQFSIILSLTTAINLYYESTNTNEIKDDNNHNNNIQTSHKTPHPSSHHYEYDINSPYGQLHHYTNPRYGSVLVESISLVKQHPHSQRKSGGRKYKDDDANRDIINDLKKRFIAFDMQPIFPPYDNHALESQLFVPISTTVKGRNDDEMMIEDTTSLHTDDGELITQDGVVMENDGNDANNNHHHDNNNHHHLGTQSLEDSTINKGSTDDDKIIQEEISNVQEEKLKSKTGHTFSDDSTTTPLEEKEEVDPTSVSSDFDSNNSNNNNTLSSTPIDSTIHSAETEEVKLNTHVENSDIHQEELKDEVNLLQNQDTMLLHNDTVVDHYNVERMDGTDTNKSSHDIQPEILKVYDQHHHDDNTTNHILDSNDIHPNQPTDLDSSTTENMDNLNPLNNANDVTIGNDNDSQQEESLPKTASMEESNQVNDDITVHEDETDQVIMKSEDDKVIFEGQEDENISIQTTDIQESIMKETTIDEERDTIVVPIIDKAKDNYLSSDDEINNDIVQNSFTDTNDDNMTIEDMDKVNTPLRDDPMDTTHTSEESVQFEPSNNAQDFDTNIVDETSIIEQDIESISDDHVHVINEDQPDIISSTLNMEIENDGMDEGEVPFELTEDDDLEDSDSITTANNNLDNVSNYDMENVQDVRKTTQDEIKDENSQNQITEIVEDDEEEEEVTTSPQITASKPTVNDEFVHGLDDIHKFLEEVDPPDELDVGAAGSSIQEVLMGQGAQIIKRNLLKGLNHIQKSFDKVKKQKWDSVVGGMNSDEFRDGPFGKALVVIDKNKMNFVKSRDFVMMVYRNILRQTMEFLGNIGLVSNDDDYDEDEDDDINNNQDYLSRYGKVQIKDDEIAEMRRKLIARQEELQRQKQQSDNSEETTSDTSSLSSTDKPSVLSEDMQNIVRQRYLERMKNESPIN